MNKEENKQFKDNWDKLKEWLESNWEKDLSLNDLVLKQKEEIERLNNIINELERLVDDYAWNSYYFKCGNRYLKSEILNDIREIIEPKGSDKE